MMTIRYALIALLAAFAPVTADKAHAEKSSTTLDFDGTHRTSLRDGPLTITAFAEAEPDTKGLRHPAFQVASNSAGASLAADHGDRVRRIVMRASGDGCRTEIARNECSVFSCPGPAGYALRYSDSVTMAGLTVLLRGRELHGDGAQWMPAGSGIGALAEWHLVDDQPVAALVGRWRKPEFDNSAEQSLEEILVIKVSATKTCEVASVGAFAPDALAVARRFADDTAPSFRCGVDQPSSRPGPANAGLARPDTSIDDGALLIHNGSVMQISRPGRGAAMEISYEFPRGGLGVKPGTILFTGSAANGSIYGEAYVFKKGCAPAPYAVTGSRDGDGLVLQGAAPRRDPRSCAIVGNSSSSKHAVLGFEHEPLSGVLDSRSKPDRANSASTLSAVGSGG